MKLMLMVGCDLSACNCVRAAAAAVMDAGFLVLLVAAVYMCEFAIIGRGALKSLLWLPLLSLTELLLFLALLCLLLLLLLRAAEFVTSSNLRFRTLWVGASKSSSSSPMTMTSEISTCARGHEGS